MGLVTTSAAWLTNDTQAMNGEFSPCLVSMVTDHATIFRDISAENEQ